MGDRHMLVRFPVPSWDELTSELINRQKEKAVYRTECLLMKINIEYLKVNPAFDNTIYGK